MRITSFKDLVVWQLSDKLFMMIVADAEKFPASRAARIITDQVIRSIASIGANIAEGAGRGGKRELTRYLIIARGSLVESQDWIHKLSNLGYITVTRQAIYEDLFITLRIKINAFIGKLRT